MAFDFELFNERMNDLKPGMKFMIRARSKEDAPAHFMAAIIMKDTLTYHIVGTCWSVEFHDWTDHNKKVLMYQRYMGMSYEGQPETQFTNVFRLMPSDRDVWEIGEIEVKE